VLLDVLDDGAEPHPQQHTIEPALRLACRQRAAVIPSLALVLLLCRWPNKYFFFAVLAATAVVAWLVVWAFLYPDLRWLNPADRPSRVRANSAEFVRQREPSERALLFRRRILVRRRKIYTLRRYLNPKCYRASPLGCDLRSISHLIAGEVRGVPCAL
jgi:hypothetical protein